MRPLNLGAKQERSLRGEFPRRRNLTAANSVLRMRLWERGITIQGLAKRMGVSRFTLSQVINRHVAGHISHKWLPAIEAAIQTYWGEQRLGEAITK